MYMYYSLGYGRMVRIAEKLIRSYSCPTPIFGSRSIK
jgi:hypothetical protein